MEEEKAAAYYDELTRKGEGAARFKQGLGFSSSSNDAVPSRGAALPSSSFLSKFVKASSPSKNKELEKQANIESIQSKLKKKPKDSQTDSSFAVSRDKDREKSRSSRRSRSRSRSRDKTRRRSTSRDNVRNTRRRSRSRSRDGSRRSKRRSRSRGRDRERHSRRRSRSLSRDSDRNPRRRSPSVSRDGSRNGHSNHRDRSRSRGRDDHESRRSMDRSSRERERLNRKMKSKSQKVDDYGKLIEGYDNMTPAERVKAKMKLQLSETVQKDETKGAGAGWERFNFDKDAPLDDEEIDAAEDDTSLVKHIGQSFRYSAIESRREDQIKADHDEAMFGAPSISVSAKSYDEMGEDSELPVVVSSLSDQGDSAGEESKKVESRSVPWADLISAQAVSMQQGCWRDRVRKL